MSQPEKAPASQLDLLVGPWVPCGGRRYDMFVTHTFAAVNLHHMLLLGASVGNGVCSAMPPLVRKVGPGRF